MLFRNTLAQSTGLVVSYLFSFLLAPLMISRLGLDQFGVWAVTGAFAAYAGLLDLGVGRSLVRFIAIFDVDGRLDKIRECVGLGLIVVVVVGVAALAAVALAAPLLSDQLGVLNTGEMRAVAMASVGIWTFNGFQGVFNGVALGKRQMVPPNIAIAIGATVNFAFSVAALLSSDSLVVYALANAAAALIAIVPCFVAMRSLWRRPYWGMPSRSLVREVLAFSVKEQLGWMAELVNLQTDKVVIALAVDVRSAAIYEIASRVVMGVRALAIMSVSAMVPTAAAKIVSEGRQVVGPMFRRYTLRSCAIAFPLFVVAAVTAPFLLVAWLGEAPGDSVLLVPFLTLAFMFNITTGAGSTIALAAGHPGVVAVNSVLIAILNVVLTVALAPVFGIWGVVLGTFIALILGSLRLTQRILKLFELPWGDFFRGVGPTAGLALGVGVPPALLAILVGTPSGRLEATLLLAVGAAIYLLPYWTIATRLDYLPSRLRFPLLAVWQISGERGMSEAVTSVSEAELDDSQRAQWRQLAELRGNPFLTPEWFRACRAAGAEEEAFVLLWRRGDRLGGVLPLVRPARGRLRRARFAGADWADWLGPLCRPEDERSMAGDCADWLAENAAEWQLLEMTRIDDDSAWPAALWEEGDGRIAAARPRRTDTLPYIRFEDGGFSAYLSSRSRNFRSQLGRRRRRLEAEHGLEFRMTGDPGELEQDLEVFFDLHDERWRGRGGSQALPPLARSIHRDFAAAALRRGWLRLWIAEVDGAPGAAWYGWRVGDRYCYALSGLSDDFAPFALGTVLLAHTIEMAAAEGAPVYDLLRGDESYKKRFETDRRQAESWVLGRRRHPATLAQSGADRLAGWARELPQPLRSPLKRAYRLTGRA